MKKKKKNKAVIKNAERIVKLEWSDRLMVYSVGEMAKRGSEILGELRTALGCAPSSGHVLDALMNAAAEMERAAGAGDSERYADALTVTLFLARDLAFKQGKIRVDHLGEKMHEQEREGASGAAGAS